MTGSVVIVVEAECFENKYDVASFRINASKCYS